MYVFSLSSIPSRFGDLRPALESILAQTVRPERILLYIPRHYRRFPEYDGSLPDVPKGVEIRRVAEDLGPATKVLYAATEFAGQDVAVIFGDDDRHYHRSLAERLLGAARQHPRAAITAQGYSVDLFDRRTAAPLPHAQRHRRDGRTRSYIALQAIRRSAVGRLAQAPRWLRPTRSPFLRSGFVDVAEGFGGVLIRPDFFRPEDLDLPEIARAMDDIWLSALLASRNIPVWLEAGIPMHSHGGHLRDALYAAIIDGRDRDAVNLRCLAEAHSALGVWPPVETGEAAGPADPG